MSLERICSGAGCSKTSGLMKCSGCEEVAYCSKECQASTWKTHKNRCWGRKYPIIVKSVEISLFGENKGGSASEQLARIESRLQQSSPPAVPQSIVDQQKRVENLLSATYMPPVVTVSEKEFAVFSPFCYHGCLSTMESALLVVKAILTAIKDNKGDPPIPAERGFICSAVLSHGLPLLNWEEHSVIALYLSRFYRIRQEGESIFSDQQLLSLNRAVSLPRSEIPGDIIIPVIGSDGNAALVITASVGSLSLPDVD